MIRHLKPTFAFLQKTLFQNCSRLHTTFELKLESEQEDYLIRKLPSESVLQEAFNGYGDANLIEEKVGKHGGVPNEGVFRWLTEAQITTEKQEQMLRRFPEISDISLTTVESLMKSFQQFGMKRSEVFEMLVNYPEIFSFHFSQDVQPILSYFTSIFSEQQATVELIGQCPVLLTYSLELDIKPKMSYFQKLGVQPIELKEILLAYPSVLALSVKKSIERKIDYLRTRLPGLDVLKMILNFPGFLDMSLDAHIKEKMEFFLDKMEVNPEKFARYLPEFPAIFSCEIETNIKPKIEYLCRQLDIVEGKLKRLKIRKRENLEFLSCPSLFGLSRTQLRERIEHISYLVFKNKEMMDHLFLQCPLLFGCSINSEDILETRQILMEALSSNRTAFLTVLRRNPSVLLTPPAELRTVAEKVEDKEMEIVVEIFLNQQSLFISE